MLIVHLFVSYAHVTLCHFSLPPGVGGWLRLLLVALPGLFCLPFYSNCHCLSAVCLSLIYCSILFRIALWPSVGKELSRCLSTCAVFILVPSIL